MRRDQLLRICSTVIMRRLLLTHYFILKYFRHISFYIHFLLLLNLESIFPVQLSFSVEIRLIFNKKKKQLINESDL